MSRRGKQKHRGHAEAGDDEASRVPAALASETARRYPHGLDEIRRGVKEALALALQLASLLA